MKNNPAVPEGSLKSKPTWLNTFGCSATSAFFVLGDKRRSQLLLGFTPSKEVSNGSAFADYFDRAAHGRLANLGLQSKLGLRPQRWLGSGAFGRVGAGAHGAHSPWLLTEYGCGKEYAEDRKEMEDFRGVR